jgi:hypothetical protein
VWDLEEVEAWLEQRRQTILPGAPRLLLALTSVSGKTDR